MLIILITLIILFKNVLRFSSSRSFQLHKISIPASNLCAYYSEATGDPHRVFGPRAEIISADLNREHSDRHQ